MAKSKSGILNSAFSGLCQADQWSGYEPGGWIWSIANAPEIMIGTGSACTSGAIEPSHVLTAMGVSREDASSTIRISLGRFNNQNEVSVITKVIKQAFDILSHST